MEKPCPSTFIIQRIHVHRLIFSSLFKKIRLAFSLIFKQIFDEDFELNILPNDISENIIDSQNVIFYISEQQLECLTNPSKMGIVSDNGNKYVFNNDSSYNENKKYGLNNGTYRITNVPSDHPIALLNNGNPNITYAPVVNTDSPIEIKVSGGVFIPGPNNDYFTFKDSSNNDIKIRNESFKFMRGKTYRFIAAGDFNGIHQFQVYYSGVYKTLPTTEGEFIDITIPSNHSTVSGDLYYRCQPHSTMKANMKLLYRQVDQSGETTASYDFYYGTVNITVSGDFDEVSAYCYYHNYMGGQNLLKYSDTCQTL